jgi:nitronate monooxygenase
MTLPPLKIGDLTVSPPIIQGGMGVRVSGAQLAAAVANEGCVGIIASVGLGLFEDLPGSHFVEVNDEALRKQIRAARSSSKGIIGVNVMVALGNYENLIKVAVEEDVDVIISGAGLPTDLPRLAAGKNIKLIPIVSSGRALRIICAKWQKLHDRLPDAVVLEGPRAGGHLGFKYEELEGDEQISLDQLLAETLEVANGFDPPIPVIAAGGIWDGADIARVLKLGAAGVQMATRFVCTEECDVDERFKEVYLNATPQDTVIIHSPVGMPARVVRNEFVDKIERGETIPFFCEYQCLRTCDPATAPYCIAKVLANAAKGNMDEAFAFAGSNVARCDEIVPVKDLVARLVAEAEAAYSA